MARPWGRMAQGWAETQAVSELSSQPQCSSLSLRTKGATTGRDSPFWMAPWLSGSPHSHPILSLVMGERDVGQACGWERSCVEAATTASTRCHILLTLGDYGL
jgi:hypothetical protein